MTSETRGARGHAPGFHYGYIALAMGAVAITATLGFGRWAYSLILPGMKEGLALTYTQMGILGTANMLGYLASVPVAGIAASRYGSRLVIGGCMLVAGLALLATGLSPDFELALLSQTVAGIASAGAIVPSMALAGIWVAPRKRGMATGLVNSGLGLSFFVTGPVIPAMVASSAETGWRYGWYLVGGVVLLGGVLVAVLMRNRPQDLGLQVMGFAPGAVQGDPPGRPYRSNTQGDLPGGPNARNTQGDSPGGPNARNTLADLSGGPTARNTQGDPPGRPENSNTQGGLLGRPGEPNIKGHGGGSNPQGPPASALNWGLVYRSGRIWHLSILYGIFGFAFASLSTFFAAFLRDQGGLGEGVIGNMWALSGVGMIMGCLAWGSFSDRVGRAAGIAVVFFFLAAAIIFFTVSHSLVIYYISAVVFWAAEPGVPVIVAAACGDYVGGRLAPAAVGFATLFMGIGQAVGPILTGSMADVTGSFDMAFYASAGVAIMGIMGAAFLRQPGAQL